MTLTATSDGATVTYTKNQEVTITDETTGETHTEWVQVIAEVTDETTDAWNAKYYYDTETKRFTLLMKGVKVTKSCTFAFGVNDKSVTTQGGAMEFVITEDSYFENCVAIANRTGGSYRWSHTYVTSKNGATLYVDNTGKSGAGAIHVFNSLTIDANITAKTKTFNALFAVSANGNSPVLTVNGGNLDLTALYSGSGKAYSAIESDGTIEINGGRITAVAGTMGFGKVPQIAEGLCYTVMNGNGEAIAAEQMASVSKVVFNSTDAHTAGTWADGKTICTVCGAEMICEHEFTEKVTKAPTCIAEGELTKTCSVCGVVETEVMKKVSHPYVAVDSEVVDGAFTRTNTCSVCGDSYTETVKVMSGTVTLFGTAVTVDTDATTADIPEALYWVNGEEGGLPVAATAADNWNYRFAIIGNIPTVTLRNAEYSYAATFLYGRYDGSLNLEYEGTNNIYVTYKASSGYYFVNYGGATNSAGKGRLYIKGAEGATLNVTGGSKGIVMLNVANKAYLDIIGGTFSIERTNAGGVSSTIAANYGKVVIKDCNLNVKDVTGVSGKHPLIAFGNGKNYGMTITNANVNLESNTLITLCAGVFQSNMKGVLYPASVTINGESNVKIVNTNVQTDYNYAGVGFYGLGLAVNGGKLEIEAGNQAVMLSATDAIPTYAKYSKLYTEKGGEEATEYAATPYLKIVTPAPLETAYTITIAGENYTIGSYDSPIYLLSVTKSGYYRVSKTVETTDETTGETTTTTVTEHVAGDYVIQTTEGADENNWNAKLIWHTGDAAPTLYLKNFVLDNYNEELGGGKWRVQSSTSTNPNYNAAIRTGKTAPLSIIVEGECSMQMYDGIHYQNDLSIKGIDGANLSVWTQWTGIVPASNASSYTNDEHLLSGNKLTLDVNLTVSLGSWPNVSCAGHIIRTIDADMIINGGNITTELRGGAEKSCKGIGVVGSGNLYINGGYIKSASYNSANLHEGAIQVAGNIYITGGTVEATSAHQSGLRAANIYISGGKVIADAYYAALLVNENGVIEISGGAIEAITRAKAYSTFRCYVAEGKGAQNTVLPTVTAPEGMMVAIVAGDTKDDAFEIIRPEYFGYDGKYISLQFVESAEPPVCEHTHVYVEEEVDTAATCTTAGSKWVYKQCESCFEVLMNEAVEIPALGHTEEIIPGKEATETEPGLTEGKKCSVCGEILVAQVEIPATGSGECVDHVYTDDNDAVCDNCGFIRKMVDTFDFINYRVVFADSDTTHKNFRVELYKLGNRIVEDPTSEAALRAIDAAYKTYWGAEINTILLTEAGNYVALLKYNVGTATVKVPMVITVDADPKLIIDKNNKLTVLDTNETHGHLRIFVYYLGDQTVEDIYDTAALDAIDPSAALSENIIYHKMFIDKTALTKGGNYVVHLCWNIGTGPKITKAQQFSVFAIPTLTLDVNNMLWMSDENAENNSHRLVIYKMADDLDLDSYDIYNETAVKADAIETSKTYWGAAEINGLEIYERGNYIIHLYYSVGTSAKRTIAIGTFLNDRPVAGVTDENKLSMSFTDPDITNERVYYYYFGQNSTEGLDLYNKTALQNAAVSYTTNAIWTKNTISKTELKELGNYVIHFEYNVKTYDEEGNATGSAKKVVVVETTIYNPTKPVVTLGEDNKLVASHDNPDAKSIRATVYKLGDKTVENIYDETALKAIDSAAATKWGLTEINKVQLTEAGNYVILVKYNVGTQTRIVAFQFTV